MKDYSPYLNAKEFEEQDPWYGFLPRTSVGLEFRMAKQISGRKLIIQNKEKTIRIKVSDNSYFIYEK